MAKISDDAEFQILVSPVRRLEPSSKWRGRRMREADLFGFDEAADLASSHAGVQITIGNILQAAARGEIPLHAILREQKSFILVGENKLTSYSLDCDDHCLLPLPLHACDGLSLGEIAVNWRDYERITKLEGGATWVWLFARVAPDQTEIHTVRDDCRINGRAVHALADHILGALLMKCIKRKKSKVSPVVLRLETRIALDTGDAAYHLNRSQQTLRIWACKGTGPIKPVRINGRLAWPVADIRRLLGVAQDSEHNPLTQKFHYTPSHAEGPKSVNAEV